MHIDTQRYCTHNIRQIENTQGCLAEEGEGVEEGHQGGEHHVIHTVPAIQYTVSENS